MAFDIHGLGWPWPWLRAIGCFWTMTVRSDG